MSTESHFFYASAIVLSALIVAIAFGHCDDTSESFKRFKICMERNRDISKCDEPVQKRFTVNETPSK